MKAVDRQEMESSTSSSIFTLVSNDISEEVVIKMNITLQ